MKRIFLIFGIFLLAFTLVSCDLLNNEPNSDTFDDLKTYSLTIPNEVSANVEDLLNITENTLVVLTVTIPEGKILDDFLFNNNSYQLNSNNEYEFYISENVIVNVTFKNIEEEVIYHSITLNSNLITLDIDNLLEVENNTLVTGMLTDTEFEYVSMVFINNNSVVITNNSFSFNITEDSIITVLISYYTYSLTLPTGVTTTDGTFVDLNTRNIRKNSLVTLNINVPFTKQVSQFKVNGVDSELVNNTFTFTITEDTIILITFEPIPITEYYSVTTVIGVNVDHVTPNAILENSLVTLNLEDITGYNITKVFLNEVEIEFINGSYEFIIESDVYITIEKDKKEFTLTLPDEVTSNLGNNILFDTLVTLNIDVLENYEVTSFKINGFERVNLLVDNEYSFKMFEDTIVEVVIEEIKVYYEITYTGALIIIVLDGNINNVLENSLVKVVIKHEDFIYDGFRADKIIVNGTEYNYPDDFSDSTYQFNIKEDTHIELVLEEVIILDTFNILGVKEDFLINQPSFSNIEEGTLVTLTLKENPNYTIEKIFFNGTEVFFIDDEYEFIMTENIVITIALIPNEPQ